MAKHFDKDTELDEEGEDAYAAAMAGAVGGKHKAGDDDKDDEEDEPSVEAEIAAQESGILIGDEGVKPKKPTVESSELDEEEKAADELRMIEELAEGMEEERTELLNEEEEGL